MSRTASVDHDAKTIRTYQPARLQEESVWWWQSEIIGDGAGSLTPNLLSLNMDVGHDGLGITRDAKTINHES